MTPPSDVIVVGGGVVGCSIAYRLARAGRQVTLYEQRGLASGASGRNGGLTGEGSSLYASRGDAVYAVTSANLKLLQELPEELDADFELQLPGTLDIATTEAQWHHLQTTVTAQRAASLNVELLSNADVRRLIPAVSPDVLGAKFAPGHGHLWPFGLVMAFANAAQRLGTVIHQWTPVLRLHYHGDHIAGVVTEDGIVESDEVVLATNAYTPLLMKSLPAGAIVPARGQILVTQPLPPILPHPFGTNYDKEYGRQVPGGPILCGGFRRFDVDQGLGHYEERVTAQVVSGIAKCLASLFPALRDAQVVRCWSGIMGFTADGVPLIGRSDANPGLTIAAGFNGGGFSWAAITGKIVEALINQHDPGFDLQPFRPDRFSQVGTEWSNPFTAGEESALAISTSS